MLDAVLALNGLDTQVFNYTGVSAAPQDSSDAITVPDAHLLFSGEFTRVGTTGLKITGDDGKSFFIEDYFSGEKQKNLLSPAGAILSADVVQALAGPLAPGQQAQAGGQQSAQTVIGRVDAASGSCTVVRNGVSVALNAGDLVQKGDVVQTSSASAVSIVFTDGTTFSLSANARMVLNDFVYNANGGNNSAAISLVQGTFSFIAGQVAKTGEMRVDTPVATMGIRGTAVKADVTAADGTTRFTVMEETNPNTGVTSTGSFVLLDKTTGQVLATVNSASVSYVLAPSGPQQLTITPVQRTPAEIQQDAQVVQQLSNAFNNYQTNPIKFDSAPDQQQSPQKDGLNQGPGSGSGGAPLNTLGQQTNVTVTITATGSGNTPIIGNVPALGGTTTGVGIVTPVNNNTNTPTGGTVQQPTETITVINGSGIIIGTPGKDLIYGSDGADSITALQGNDSVFAGGGNDIILAAHGEGNDFYDGGTGVDTIRYDSANGVIFQLNVGTYTLADGTVVKLSTADGVLIDHDEFVRTEKIVGSPGNDVFVLHDLGDWEIDGGDGVDIVRVAGDFDFSALTTGGPQATNIEIIDLGQSFTDKINLKPADVWTALGLADPTVSEQQPAGTHLSALRILGGTTDVVELSDTYQVGGTGPTLLGRWQLVGNFVDPTTDNSEGDPFNDHVTDGVTFREYQFLADDGSVLATLYVQDGVQVQQVVTTTNAVNDTASMGENEVRSVDVVSNDAPDFVVTKTLLALGTASITGPQGVALGTPTIAIENNQIKVTPGDAFDALAEGETATISVPYTVQLASGQTLTATAVITVNGANDAPATSAVILAAVAEDGTRLITSAELLANASDVDGDSLAVSNLQIASGNGTLVNNNNGTWTYTPAANDDTSVSFSYTISDGGTAPNNVAGSATLDITPINDAPTTAPVTLAEIAEDSGARIITSAELLANAADVEGNGLTVSDLEISSGNGTLVNNNNGTWTYTPAANDDTSVSFSYTISDGGTAPNNVAGSATLDITPINDAPTTAPVTLAEIAEDSGARIITSAELLANAADIEDTGLTVSDLQIASGNGTLVNNNNGTWTYTPAANDDTSVSFSYTISDGGTAPNSVVGSATLDITPVAEPISAEDDYAGMTENQVLFVDVTANDATDVNTSKTLASLDAVTITGPEGVQLGTPAIVIENNKIRVTPGTAFDALAEGETATIEVPYTIHLGTGENLTATAIITVTGTNDAPHFSTLPEGYEAIGTVNTETSFGGVEAVALTTEGASQSQIENFLELDAGALSAVNSETTDGAAIAFDLDLAEGETVVFSWNFASTEYEPYNDYAFFSVSGGEASDSVVKLSDIYTIGDSANDGYLHSSGWQQFTYTAESEGDYRFGIGTMNTIDSAFDSSLYISGFSGLGFRRTTTESGNIETFDLLNGATDPDTNDVLIATNVLVVAKDDEGNEVYLGPDAYTISGSELSINPHYFEYLSSGQSVTVVATYDVSDGNSVMHNSATLVVNGEGEAEAPSVATLSVASNEGFDTGSLLLPLLNSDVTDIGADHIDLHYPGTQPGVDDDLVFHITAQDLQWTEVAPGEYTFTSGAITGITISRINENGSHVVATLTGLDIPATDVAQAVAAYNANGNTTPFANLFQSYSYHATGGAGADVLVGGLYADVLDGGAGNDSLTGGGGDDIFVFSASSAPGSAGPGQDTITDFEQGHDRISFDTLYSTETQTLRFGQFSDLDGHITVVGNDTQIDLGDGDKVTLHNFTGTLTANDFIFQQNNGNLFV